MKLRLNEIDKRWKEYALAGCVCILFFLCIYKFNVILSALWYVYGVIKPVFLGFVIAYIVNPLAVFFDSKVLRGVRREKLRWILSSVLAFILVLALITLVIASVVPQIIENVVSLIDNLSVYVATLQNTAESMGESASSVVDDVMEYIAGDDGLISQAGTLLRDNLQDIFNVTSNIGSSIINVGIGTIIAIYFLLSKASIAEQVQNLFRLLMSPLKYEKARVLGNKFNSIFSKYIICQLLDTVIISVVNYLCMAMLRMPDAILISVIAGVTNLAPTFGPVIGAVFGSFILLLVQPSAVIPYLIITVVLQTADAYVIKPKMFGGALNVPGVLILISIIVFGKLMGVVGMLLAIPFAAILCYIYTEMLVPWLRLRKEMQAYKKEYDKADVIDK